MKECTVCLACFPDNLEHCPVDSIPLKFSIRGDLVLDARYKLERRLGRGGMGIVFKASHILLRSTHAIKVILPDLVGEDPMLVTRFRQEAVVAASIRHKNIVLVTDFGVADGTLPFLVMEFLAGRSLWQIICERGRLSTKASLEIMEALVAGVGAAHRRGIVHRDLKPLNIFVQDGMPITEGLKILDFGLAKIKSADLFGSLIQAKTTSAMGSPLYMAPEQWSEGEPDARADIYSIGIILYQMLAGDTPFTGTSMPKIMKGHLMTEPPSFASLGVKVSRPVEEVVRHALEKDPRNRPSSVDELLAELREAISKEIPDESPMLMTTLRNDQFETATQPRLSRETDEFDAVAREPFSLDDEVLLETQRKIEDEADRLMRELEDAQRRAEEARGRVEEAARKRAEKEAERKRAEAEAALKREEEEEARKLAAEEERKRVAAEQARKNSQEEEARRLAEEELRREAEEQLARKLAAEEATQLSREVEEARRRADEARRRAEEEAQGRAKEEAARRIAEERSERLAREVEEAQQRAEEAHKRAEEEERNRAEKEAERELAEEQASRKRREEEEQRTAEDKAARKHAKEEAERLAREFKEAERRVEEAGKRAEEEAQLRAEAEAARKRAEEEAIRLTLEVEVAQRRAEEVRQLAEEEARRRAQEEAQRLAAEETARKRAEEEAIRLAREVEEAKQREEIRKLAEEEARETAKELERKFKDQQEGLAILSSQGNTGEEVTNVPNVAPPFSRADDEPLPGHQQSIAGRGQLVASRSQRTTTLKWTLSVIVFMLLVVGGYAGFRLMRPTQTQPLHPDMVSIPGGTFTMGSDNGGPQEAPAHPVTVSAFSIERTQVTNAEYADFVREANYSPPSHWSGNTPLVGQEKYPIVNVSFEDAQAFATWRSKRDGATYRLPTEEEWEYAAKGVGSFPQGASAWGVLDMVGNVLEWTSSRASIYPGNKEMMIDNDKKEWPVVRGSSYTARSEQEMAVTMRQWVAPSHKDPRLGFRLVHPTP